ncbi:MAG TPA: hypothetical protein VF941_23430 [Clostridia bacterium]
MTLDFGVKVSKVNQDVKTALDKDIQFSSKFSTLKILGKGDTSLTTDGSGNGSVSVAHNLGYSPAYLVFRKGTASFSFLDASTYANSFTPVTDVPSLWFGQNSFTTYTNTSNLVISASSLAANTTYNFRYYYLVDLAQSYSGASGISLVDDYGLKVSQANNDVKTGTEYNMGYSQKYKSLQYYDVSYQTQSLSLPLMYSDPMQKTVEAGTYVDIDHGLGYQPFFMAWALNAFASGQNIFVPFQQGYGNLAANQDGIKSVDGFCDSTRIRLSFYEKSVATANNVNGPKFQALTVTIKCIIFTENLTT